MEWGDEAIKLKLWCALVWHCVVAPIESHPAFTAPSQLVSPHQPCQTSIGVSPAPPQAQTCPVFNVLRGGISFSPSDNNDDQTCPAFNKGNYFDNSSHLSLLHVCSYCLQTVTTHRCIVNVRESPKMGQRRGLAQISLKDTEGVGYHPPNRCGRSFAHSYIHPHMLNPPDTCSPSPAEIVVAVLTHRPATLTSTHTWGWSTLARRTLDFQLK